MDQNSLNNPPSSSYLSSLSTCPHLFCCIFEQKIAIILAPSFVTNAIVKAFLLVEVTITILSLKYKSHPKPKNYNNRLSLVQFELTNSKIPCIPGNDHTHVFNKMSAAIVLLLICITAKNKESF
jgi:hypothetical protein